MSPIRCVRLSGFLPACGHSPGVPGERERSQLARIPGLGDFELENNRVLQPFVGMQYILLRTQAEHGQWISPEARQARLDQIERDYQRDARILAEP